MRMSFQLRAVSLGLFRNSWSLTFIAAFLVSAPLGGQEKGAGKDPRLVEADRVLSESRRLYRAGAYEKSLAEGQRALEARRRLLGGEDPSVAEALEELARSEMALARYAEAEGLAKRAVEIREKESGPESRALARSLCILADVYFAKRDVSQAQRPSERALEMAAKVYSLDDLTYAEILSRAGLVQAELENYSRSEDLQSRALEIARRSAGGDSLAAADVSESLGRVYLKKGDNLRAEENLRNALAIKEKVLGGEHPDVGLILHCLGLIQYRRRDYPAAEALSSRALAIREKSFGPSHPQVAGSLNNLGLISWKTGNFPKAREYFQRSLEIAEKAEGLESTLVANALGNLGIIAKESGDYDAGQRYYERALAIGEKVHGPQHRSIVVPVESLGILHRDKGDYAAAEPYFLRALRITEGSVGPDHPDVIRQLQALVKIYSAQGDADKALAVYRRIRDVEEKNLPLNLAVGSERQKLAYFEPFARTQEEILSFQVGRAPEDPAARDLAAATLLQRKGRVLDAMADSLASMRERSSPADKALLEELREVTSSLAKLVLNGPQKTPLAEHQKKIQAVTQRRDDVEDRVHRSGAGYYERSDAVTLPAVQAAVPADAVLAEFAVYRPFDPREAVESPKRWGDPRYVVYVVPRRGEVSWKDLGSASAIDRAVEAFRKALRDPGRDDVKRTARDLDQRILRPVRELAPEARRLLLSPDGQLDLIPFEALIDETGRYCVERYSVTYLSAGRDLLRLQTARRSASGPLVLADPSFGEPDAPRIADARVASSRRSITTGADLESVYFAPISGTAEEARAIRALFPDADVLTGPQATESALKRAEAPRVLHIATHGFFLQDSSAASRIENPLLRSGLALAGANRSKGAGEDGILTALEAASLNLWGTKLVTLSACDTGVGEVKNGEGVYGLRRAFVLAGAETLVMSLWPVSDRVTREVMTAYYKGLKKGAGRGEALRRAQLTMLKRRGREHPFYWASFIQSGEWAPLDGRR
jgi:CHAT domain-containing protein